MIHSISQPIAVAWDSCLFENIIVAHFTELNFFKQAWGHHFQPCCVPVFHNASLPHLAPVVCCDLIHATLVSFIDCHMKYMVLKLFEAGLGSSVSTIIVSEVAVARFLRVCYCVPICVKKERHGKQMLSTTTKMV